MLFSIATCYELVAMCNQPLFETMFEAPHCNRKPLQSGSNASNCRNLCVVYRLVIEYYNKHATRRLVIEYYNKHATHRLVIEYYHKHATHRLVIEYYNKHATQTCTLAMRNRLLLYDHVQCQLELCRLSSKNRFQSLFVPTKTSRYTVINRVTMIYRETVPTKTDRVLTVTVLLQCSPGLLSLAVPESPQSPA